MSVMIDIPMPEDCENCLICSLVPFHARLDLREHGLQYRLYCKVTGACVSGKGRDKACPLHDRKKGKWLDIPDGYKCSECGAYLEIDCGDAEMKFCPNCGARMEEGGADG